MNNRAGPLDGALEGWLSSSGLLLPVGMSPLFFDNFVFSSATRVGDMNWNINVISATPTWGTLSGGNGGAGVASLTTNANPEAGSISTPTMFGVPPVNSFFAARVFAAASGYTAFTQWVGIGSNGAVAPAVATAVNFLGFRSINGANWNFVAKNGAGAGSETTIDMGVAPSNSALRILGYRMLSLTSAEAFLCDFGDSQRPDYTSKGTVSTNIGSVGGQMQYGGSATTATARTIYIDWICLAGRVAQAT